jgi:hypothetical protein
MAREMPTAVGALKRLLWGLRPVQSVHHLRRARRDVARLDPRCPERAPVLVYQMAKVGSTTVHATLEALDPPRRPCLKVHFLSPDGARRERALDRRVGGFAYVSYYGALAVRLGERLRRLGGRFQLPVVSLVRDPIARSVSGLFQSPDFARVSLRDRSGRFDVDRVVAYLEERFQTADPCGGAEAWFDDELAAVFGVDVFAQPFPREQGYTILRGQRARVLLLRLEDLDRTLGAGLLELLDLPKQPAIVRSNLRERSADAAEYARVLERFRLPREIVEEIYARRMVGHFYTEEMIERFRRRWTRS